MPDELTSEIRKLFAREREEFFMLCMIRFGMDEFDNFEYVMFRKSVYPDYFTSENIPSMSPDWFRDMRLTPAEQRVFDHGY